MQLMPGWHSDDIGEFTFLPGGYANDNYRFRHGRGHYVLRVPRSERLRTDLEREREFYCAPGEILVPELCAFDMKSGSMICRWVEGDLLIESPPEAPELVEFLKKLHRNMPATAAVYDPVRLSRSYLSQPGPHRPHRRIAELARNTTWPQDALWPCHNDCNPWNIIRVNDESWVTLDWESRGRNDPLFDLVTVHQGLGFDLDALPELCEQLLVATVDSARIELMVTGYWLREYAWAFAARQRGNRRREIGEQLRTAQSQLMDMAG